MRYSKMPPDNTGSLVKEKGQSLAWGVRKRKWRTPERTWGRDGSSGWGCNGLCGQTPNIHSLPLVTDSGHPGQGWHTPTHPPPAPDGSPAWCATLPAHSTCFRSGPERTKLGTRPRTQGHTLTLLFWLRCCRLGPWEACSCYGHFVPWRKLAIG